jgi:phosphoinositide-3-kinase regulatory subunit 4
MDIFSVGCVIAELFLDGTPIFTLSQLLRYRQGEYDPTQIISRIQDPVVQNLVLDMIHFDPLQRKSAEEYLQHEFFHPNIKLAYDFISRISFNGHEPTTFDTKIQIMYRDFNLIFSNMLQVDTNSKGNNVARYKSNNVVLLFAWIICSSLRHLLSVNLFYQALEMLLELSRYTESDNVYVLDRFIPYLVYCFQNDDPNVVSLAVEVLTEMVRSIGLINVVGFCREYYLRYRR